MLLSTLAVNAQKEWTLDECVDYALENNISVKQAEVNTSISKWNHTIATYTLFPTVSGFASHTYNWGQRIDPFTNQFATNRVRSNSFGVNAQMTLFSGFQNVNRMQQRKLEYLAAKYGIDKIKNDISMNVVMAYLDIIFAEEMVKLGKEQVDLSQKQVDRMKDLVEVGSEPEGSLLEIEAQLASDKVNLVNSESQLQMATLNMIQLLQLEKPGQFKVARPDVSLEGQGLDITSPELVYEKALEIMPEIKQSETQMMATEKALHVARGGYYPRITMSASYGTGYSGLRTEVTGVNVTGSDTIGYTSGGDVVLTPAYDVLTQKVAFGDQLSNNVNQTVGFSMTVPIFSGMQTRGSHKIAQLNLANARWNYELQKNTLQQNIQKAYTDALGAKKKLDAATISVESFEKAFKYAEVRYESGLINAVDFNTAKTNYARAKSDRIQALFDFIFKTKILDYYQGKKLTMN